MKHLVSHKRISVLVRKVLPKSFLAIAKLDYHLAYHSNQFCSASRRLICAYTIERMDQLDLVLKLGYVLRSTGYVLGIEALEQSVLVKLLAWIAAFKFAKKSPYVLAWAALTFPHFRLGLGRKDADEISPAEHLWRLFAFRKVDVKFAPKVPLWLAIKASLAHGLWQRHKMEGEIYTSLKTSYRMYMPFQRFDYSKPATLVYFLTDTIDVEKVLTDREVFPTRGHTGFTDIVGEGESNCFEYSEIDH